MMFWPRTVTSGSEETQKWHRISKNLSILSQVLQKAPCNASLGHTSVCDDAEGPTHGSTSPPAAIRETWLAVLPA